MLVPERYRRNHPSLRRSFFEGPVSRPMGAGRDLFGLRKDGSEFPVEIGLNPIETDEGTMVLSAIVDITERTQAARELEETHIGLAQSRAEEALRRAQAELAHVARVTTLGELTGSIAHEMNQPLAAIVNAGAACRRWLDRRTPDLDEARSAVEWIITEASRAGKVIHRIRALANKVDITQKAPLDINDVVNEIIPLVQSELISHKVSLRMELAAALPVVLADRVQQQQVIINLVMNSIEAMQPVTDRPRELV